MGQIHRQAERDLIELINIIKKKMLIINQVFHSLPSISKTLVYLQYSSKIGDM